MNLKIWGELFIMVYIL